MPRPTPVRDAVRTAFTSGKQHAWSMEELVRALREHGVPADTSSVFRALGALEAEGFIERFELGDGRSHFELVGEHHEHICCERCGLVVSVPGCLLADVEQHVLRTTGFLLRAHSVVLRGVCPTCRT